MITPRTCPTSGAWVFPSTPADRALKQIKQVVDILDRLVMALGPEVPDEIKTNLESLRRTL